MMQAANTEMLGSRSEKGEREILSVLGCQKAKLLCILSPPNYAKRNVNNNISTNTFH